MSDLHHPAATLSAVTAGPAPLEYWWSGFLMGPSRDPLWPKRVAYDEGATPPISTQPELFVGPDKPDVRSVGDFGDIMPLTCVIWGFTASTARMPLVYRASEAQQSTFEARYSDLVVTERGLSWPAALARLDELESLSPGWDSYGADPISPQALQRVKEILFALRDGPYPGERAMPQNIAPIADGGIQLEWWRASGYLEVEITAAGAADYWLLAGAEPGRRSFGEEGIATPEVVRQVFWFLGGVVLV